MRLDESLKGRWTTDGLIDFYEHISRVREEASDWLEGMQKNGIDHSKRLEGYLDRLIPDQFKKKLKPAETFILLLAVYLHDIGYRNEKGQIESHNHPLRSKEFILANPDKFLFRKFRSMREGEPPPVAQAVAEVCYAHAPESVCPLRDISYDFGDQYLCPEGLNLRRLAALLRLADEMDQAYIRMGHLRDSIRLPAITTGVVRFHWSGAQPVGEALDEMVQKINTTLEPVNDVLSQWDFPKTTVVLEPLLNKPQPPPHEPIDYRKYVPVNYVEPRCHAKNQNQGSLHKFVHKWLADPRRKLLAVLGDYGIGKTSFCYRLASDLAENQHVPVVIELRHMRDADDEFEVLIKRKIEQKSPMSANTLLIFDGFDELSVKFDKDKVLQKIDELSRNTQEFSKVILTSRTPFFRSKKEEKEVLVREPGRPREGPAPLPYPEHFERIYISPFSDEEIQGYLENALGPEGALDFWDNVVDTIWDIKGLAKRPILLELITKYSKEIGKIEGVVTASKIYETVTEAWEKREEERVPRNIMLFMEELAYRMFTEEESQLYFDTLTAAIDIYFDDETRERLELSLDNLDYQIRTCSFLSRNVDEHYAFAHRSFMEYFVARKLSREIPEDKAVTIRISDEIALFVSELIPPTVYERINLPEGVKVPKGMVYIPPGQFIMGEGNNIRIANINEGFFIDKHPVTNAQFCDFLNECGNQREGGVEWILLGGVYDRERCRIEKKGDRFLVQRGYKEHPVILVSWYGAKAYALWAERRLPSETEWEKAARGIDGRIYPWGNEFNKKKSNCDEAGIGKITPVTEYPQDVSPYQCKGMAGNVEDWVEDDYYEILDSVPADGSAWIDNPRGSYRVVRGGSWDLPTENGRSALRDCGGSDVRCNGLSFRLSRSLP